MSSGAYRGILNNELYIGRQVWGRQTWLKDPSTGRRVARAAAAEAQVVTELPELRIVPDELWQAVKNRQALLDRRGRDAAALTEEAGHDPFWAKQRPRYLFSALMRCAECDGGFSKISATHFGCSTARDLSPFAPPLMAGDRAGDAPRPRVGWSGRLCFQQVVETE